MLAGDLIRARRTEQRSAQCSLLLLLCACSAPDGRDLFSPREGASANGGGASATGGGAGAASAGGPGSAGGTSSVAEGQGGSSLGFGGVSGGSAGTNMGAGGSGAAPPDAGTVDAGIALDAALDTDPAPCVPRSEVCDGLDNDCDDEVDPGGTCPEACAGLALDGRGYMYCAEPIPRAGALESCEGQGMHLAWLETPDESEALSDLIASSGLPTPAGNAELLTQIGGSDAADEGAWSWVGNGAIAGGFQFWQGGSPAAGGEVVGNAYVPWSAGEPTGQANEHCAALAVVGGPLHDPGVWDDRSCNEQLPYVCEAP